MLVTPLGISMFVKLVQYANAPPSIFMLVTLLWISILVKLVQL